METCGHENPPGAKFCTECAAPLARWCAECGPEPPPTAKFCPECAAPLAAKPQAAAPDPRTYTPQHLAEKILGSRAALEGERKQVTVLFADVKGSMDLAEQVDPEAWHAIMDRFFQLLAEGVHRFEGTVNQFTGDGIMALFGAPIAHEDHGQRACWAALHLQHELRRYADEVRLAHGLGFSVRMGLNSGEVVVGKIGDDLRMDYTALGHTVGLAQRMEQMADPGKALLTGHTARLVSGYFQRRDLGETRIKGLTDLLPILEFFRGYSGTTEQDAPRAARDKIAGRMLLLDETLIEGLPLMFDFLGVSDPERPAPPLGPEARQRQLLDLTRRLARARSAREPALVLYEDLHWFDRASEEFIGNVVVEIAPGSRTLVLLNFRPEYHAAWMQRSYYQQLPLLPLGPEAIKELFADLLGSDSSLHHLPELVRERTAANPSFIEEIVQSLIETGVVAGSRGAYQLVRPAEEVGLPATVQSVLAARIDRLPEREKRVLQTASVIGERFSEPILKRVADLRDGDLPATLHALTSAEFLYQEALYPEAEYTFKHPLTQEVAY